MPSEDLDGYSSGSGASAGSGGGGSLSSGGDVTVPVNDDAGSGGTGASDPAAADTTLDLPVVEPETDPATFLADAGAGPVLSDAGAAPCSADDEVAEGERCYRFATSSASWLGAFQSCRGWGGRMMVVGSAAEDALLTEHLQGDTWIGLQDILNEGTFSWENGSSATYRNFAPGEPNDGNGSDCVEKRQSDALWYDQPCALEKQYACEKALR